MDDYDLLSGDEEVISGQEIIGALEIIGATNPAAARVFKSALAKAKASNPNAAAVRNTKPGPRRRKILAAASVAPVAGANAAITFRTQELFRPERLVIVASGTGVTDQNVFLQSAKIATREQFASSGNCPIAVFGPLAVDTDVHFDDLSLGMEAILTFLNGAANPATIVAAFIGSSMYQ